MAALKRVQIQGWLADVARNFIQLEEFVNDDVGLGALRVARFKFDVEEEDNATTPADNSAIGAHPLAVVIPNHSIVVGGVVDVNTPVTSGGAATLAISIQGANDIISAANVSGAPWSTHGLKAIVPKANTPESTGIKLTEDREVTFTVATAALETGVVTGYLYYLPGIESAALP